MLTLSTVGFLLSLGLLPLVGMALLAPNAGDVVLLGHMIKDALSVADDCTLKLFTNNVTPAKTDTAATYTEATFTGYAAKALARSGWATPTTTSNVTSTTFAMQTWSPTTSQAVYGYFVVNSAGTIQFAEAFAAARTLNPGDTLNLTPQMQLN